jgi:lipid A 3-O-deacylase
MKKTLFAAIGLLSIASASAHPTDEGELALETGYLWNVGHNTDIPYQIVPTQLVYRGPLMWTWWSGDDGSRLVVRNRFALLAEAFTRGPETGYLGFSAAPSIEWWLPDEKTSAFFSIGGGAGFVDSQNEVGAQGQDFTLNWFWQLGLRREIRPGLSVLAGPYFVHHSNLGMTDPNPGIDALGVTVGLGWKF